MTGKDIIIILTQGGTALASTRVRSQDIQTQADVIEKASSTQQDWKEYIAGRKEWAVNVSYLVMTAAKVRDLLLVGQTFGVIVRDAANTYSVSGTAIMTTVKNVSTVGNLAQGSFSLKGTGALV